MSSGISKSLRQQINIESNVDESVTIQQGEGYTVSSNPFTVYENGVDVTASATISHTISGPDGSTDFSKAGVYTITYTCKYDGETSQATTKVTVEAKEEVEPEIPGTP